MSEQSAPRSSALDLEILELDPSPTFVIRVGESALEFAFIFCNKAFRRQNFKKRVEEQERPAFLFRSWAQAVGAYNPHHDFAERRWYAQEVGTDLSWKIVRVVENLWCGRTVARRQAKCGQPMKHTPFTATTTPV